MKLTLIRPCMGARERRYQEQRMEPLQLAVLASLTPPDVETTLFDERLESISAPPLRGRCAERNMDAVPML